MHRITFQSNACYRGVTLDGEDRSGRIEGEEPCNGWRRCNVSPKPRSRKESRLTTIRHGGPSGLRTRMRLAERRINPVFFVEMRAAGFDGTPSEGGCSKNHSRDAPQPLSTISLIPLWLSTVNRPARVERGKKAGTRATPPKPGGHVALDSRAVGTVKLSSLAAFSPPAATAKSLILSL